MKRGALKDRWTTREDTNGDSAQAHHWYTGHKRGAQHPRHTRGAPRGSWKEAQTSQAHQEHQAPQAPQAPQARQGRPTEELERGAHKPGWRRKEASSHRWRRHRCRRRRRALAGRSRMPPAQRTRGAAGLHTGGVQKGLAGESHSFHEGAPKHETKASLHLKC